MSFSFSFSGDDIDLPPDAPPPPPPAPAAAPGAKPSSTSSAFPVAGKPQLPPTHHPLPQLLARLPSKIAYGTLDVSLDGGEGGGGVVRIPRRELWDVRVQLMAEADDEDDDDAQGPEGLGKEDVKTGVYEGGFKSWESSVDLVKSLAAEHVLASLGKSCMRVIEVSTTYNDRSCLCAVYCHTVHYLHEANTDVCASWVVELLCPPWPCSNGSFRSIPRRTRLKCPLLLRTTTLPSCNSSPFLTSY